MTRRQTPSRLLCLLCALFWLLGDPAIHQQQPLAVCLVFRRQSWTHVSDLKRIAYLQHITPYTTCVSLRCPSSSSSPAAYLPADRAHPLLPPHLPCVQAQLPDRARPWEGRPPDIRTGPCDGGQRRLPARGQRLQRDPTLDGGGEVQLRVWLALRWLAGSCRLARSMTKLAQRVAHEPATLCAWTCSDTTPKSDVRHPMGFRARAWRLSAD